jgi:hypothetical protein
MKSIRIEQVPVIFELFRPELGKTGDIVQEYHHQSGIPQDTREIQKQIAKYLALEGRYLANPDDIQTQYKEKIAFKKISERQFTKLGAYATNRITALIKGRIILPNTFEELEELTEQNTTNVELFDARGLAKLTQAFGRDLEKGETPKVIFSKPIWLPNFMHPYELSNINFSYSKGLNFYQSE